MTRKYSSISVETTLASGISNSATTMTVATGTGSALMGGVTLAAGNVDQFTVALDVDTQNEEIVFVTAITSDTLTIVRGRAGTSAISHSGGATVKHVLTSDDLNFYTAGVATADGAVPESVVTAKADLLVGASSGVVDNLAIGTNNQVLTADSTQTLGMKWATPASGDVTLNGVQTLTNKTLSLPVMVTPEERMTVSATAATGTVNFDLSTQGVLYYTTNASGNFTLNFRGSSGATLNSILATGDSISAVFLNTNGSTAYYASAFQIDGTSVTPKWANGTAPSSGNASSIDAYTFTIIKTASATFTVLAGQTKFA
jgi:hypothetical protein